mmetsp:Transcript_37561/g.81931  ORF Transcript_37561/g.81931 Transcript_37561/m.81931 type:complete len:243 (+) Transcript_37561:907-1635(+)
MVGSRPEGDLKTRLLPLTSYSLHPTVGLTEVVVLIHVSPSGKLSAPDLLQASGIADGPPRHLPLPVYEELAVGAPVGGPAIDGDIAALIVAVVHVDLVEAAILHRRSVLLSIGQCLHSALATCQAERARADDLGCGPRRRGGDGTGARAEHSMGLLLCPALCPSWVLSLGPTIVVGPGAPALATTPSPLRAGGPPSLGPALRGRMLLLHLLFDAHHLLDIRRQLILYPGSGSGIPCAATGPR